MQGQPAPGTGESPVRRRQGGEASSNSAKAAYAIHNLAMHAHRTSTSGQNMYEYHRPQGGGGNPFDMKNLMESVKKAQTMVQAETARVQSELAA